MSHFDYENAERDIRDAGGDPDYLSHYNEGSRDRYLGKMGLNPSDYGGGHNDYYIKRFQKDALSLMVMK